MVTNDELNSKFDSLYQEQGVKKSVEEINKARQVLSEDVAQMKALLEKLAATGLESKLKAKAEASGSGNVPPQIPGHGPQRTVEDPQLTDVDREAKLEVADFNGDNDPEFTQLTQGSKSVEEYTRLFYSLATRSEFPWNEDVMISMYRQGLNPQISCGLASSRLYNMADAVQVALQMEEEDKKKVPIRHSVESLTRSERTFVDPIRNKFLHRPPRATSFRSPTPYGVIGIMRPLLATKGDKPNLEKLQRGQIFHTRVKCNDQVCSLVIDTGSCTNAVSEEAVKKLGLTVDPHPEPYHLAWITKMKLKVDKQCPVTFTIGKVKETVMRDVLPLTLCHILLARTWIWDRDVEHVGCANTYSFVDSITKYTLTCATDSCTVKLKKTSSLIRRVPPSDGILDSVPNSPESSFFQRRRIDGVAVDWFDRSCPLWKPQVKPMGMTRRI
ncbi:hypothetical protein RHMOL_Rhmol05G0135800 [Rhododendron molle]|uniref:Uncharacterized protein n=1 Tax=Rhododendron molle TaxID=49168 RepID=A0ACC0NP11_RHOML|nr:hypothetical protein RHMOL_Rhmol05G0135800 [Rhododendron molle]